MLNKLQLGVLLCARDCLTAMNFELCLQISFSRPVDLPGHRLCIASAGSLCQGAPFPVLLAQWLSYLTLQSVPRTNCLWQATSPSALSSFKGEADLSRVVKHIPAVLHVEMLVRNAKSVFVWTPLQLCICEFKHLGRRAVSVPAVCMLRGCSEPGQRVPAGSELCAKRCPGGAGGCPASPAVWAFWTGAAADLCSRFDWPNTSQQSSPLVATLV